MYREAISRPSWDEWERIGCPALVVSAGTGVIGGRPGVEVVELSWGAPGPGRHITIYANPGHEGAAHDVHLDQPDEWREALTGFLDSLHPSRPCRADAD